MPGPDQQPDRDSLACPEFVAVVESESYLHSVGDLRAESVAVGHPEFGRRGTVTDTPERALDSPFTHPVDYRAPVPGTCSRCGQPAMLGETRWWHVGLHCPDRGRKATFIPD